MRRISKAISSFINAFEKSGGSYIFIWRGGHHRDSIAQPVGFAQEDFKIAQRSYQIRDDSPAFYKKRKNLKKDIDKEETAW